MVVGTEANANFVADAEELGRFGAFAIELDLAAANGFRGDRARFEEPRGPQPFVDPHSTRSVVVWLHEAIRTRSAMSTRPAITTRAHDNCGARQAKRRVHVPAAVVSPNCRF